MEDDHLNLSNNDSQLRAQRGAINYDQRSPPPLDNEDDDARDSRNFQGNGNDFRNEQIEDMSSEMHQLSSDDYPENTAMHSQLQQLLQQQQQQHQQLQRQGQYYESQKNQQQQQQQLQYAQMKRHELEDSGDNSNVFDERSESEDQTHRDALDILLFGGRGGGVGGVGQQDDEEDSGILRESQLKSETLEQVNDSIPEVSSRSKGRLSMDILFQETNKLHLGTPSKFALEVDQLRVVRNSNSNNLINNMNNQNDADDVTSEFEETPFKMIKGERRVQQDLLSLGDSMISGIFSQMRSNKKPGDDANRGLNNINSEDNPMRLSAFLEEIEGQNVVDFDFSQRFNQNEFDQKLRDAVAHNSNVVGGQEDGVQRGNFITNEREEPQRVKRDIEQKKEGNKQWTIEAERSRVPLSDSHFIRQRIEEEQSEQASEFSERSKNQSHQELNIERSISTEGEHLQNLKESAHEEKMRKSFDMVSSTKKSVAFAGSSEVTMVTPQKDQQREIIEMRSAGGSCIADYERKIEELQSMINSRHAIEQESSKKISDLERQVENYRNAERDELNFQEIFRQNRKLEVQMQTIENEASSKKNVIEHQEKTIEKLHSQLQKSDADLQKYIEDRQTLTEKIQLLKLEKEEEIKRIKQEAQNQILSQSQTKLGEIQNYDDIVSDLRDTIEMLNNKCNEQELTIENYTRQNHQLVKSFKEIKAAFSSQQDCEEEFEEMKVKYRQLLKRFEENEKDNEQQIQQAQRFRTELEESLAKTETLSMTVDAMNQELADAKNNMRELRGQKDLLMTEKDQLIKNRETSKGKIEQLHVELEEEKGLVEKLQIEKSEMQAKFDEQIELLKLEVDSATQASQNTSQNDISEKDTLLISAKAEFTHALSQKSREIEQLRSQLTAIIQDLQNKLAIQQEKTDSQELLLIESQDQQRNLQEIIDQLKIQLEESESNNDQQPNEPREDNKLLQEELDQAKGHIAELLEILEQQKLINQQNQGDHYDESNSLKQQILELENQIKIQDKLIEEQQEQSERELEELKQEKIDLQKELQLQIEESQSNPSQGVVTELAQQINSLEQSLTSKDQTISALEEVVIDLQQQIGRHRESEDAAQQALISSSEQQATIQQLKTELEELINLNNQLVSEKEQNNNGEKEITELQKEFGYLAEKFEQKQQENHALLGDFNNLLNAQQNNELKIKQLENRNIELEELAQDCADELEGAKEYSNGLIQSIEELKEKVSDYDLLIKRQQDESEQLQNEIQSLNLKLDEDSKGKESDADEVEKLKCQLEAALNESDQLSELRMQQEQNLAELVKSLKEKEDELSQVEKDYQNQLNKLESDCLQLSESNQILQEQNDCLIESQRETEQLKHELKQRDIEIQSIVQENSEMIRRLEESESKLLSLKEQCEDLVEVNGNLSNQLQETEEQRIQESNQLEAQKEMSNKIEEQFSRELRNKENEVEGLAQQITEMETFCQQMESSNEALRKDSQAYQDIIAQLQEKISELSKKLDSQEGNSEEKIVAMTNEMAEMKNIMTNLQDGYKDLSQEYELAKSEKAQVIEDNQELSKMIEDTSAAADAKVKEVVTQLDCAEQYIEEQSGQIDDLKGQLQEVSDQLTDLSEKFSQTHMAYVQLKGVDEQRKEEVRKAQSEASEQIQQEKRRIQNDFETRVKQLQEENKQLIEQLEKTEESRQQEFERAQNLNEVIEQKEGEIQDLRAEIDENDGQLNEQLENELEYYKKQIAEKDSLFNEQSNTLQYLQQEFDDQQQKLRDQLEYIKKHSEQEMSRLTKEIQNRDAIVSRQKSDLEEMQRHVTSDRERNELEQRIQDQEDQLDRIGQELEQKSQELFEKTQELDMKENQLEQLEGAYSQKLMQLEQRLAEENNLRSQRDAEEQEIRSQLEQEKREQEKVIVRQSRQIENLSTQLEKLTANTTNPNVSGISVGVSIDHMNTPQNMSSLNYQQNSNQHAHTPDMRSDYFRQKEELKLTQQTQNSASQHHPYNNSSSHNNTSFNHSFEGNNKVGTPNKRITDLPPRSLIPSSTNAMRQSKDLSSQHTTNRDQGSAQPAYASPNSMRLNSQDDIKTSNFRNSSPSQQIGGGVTSVSQGYNPHNTVLDQAYLKCIQRSKNLLSQNESILNNLKSSNSMERNTKQISSSSQSQLLQQQQQQQQLSQYSPSQQLVSNNSFTHISNNNNNNHITSSSPRIPQMNMNSSYSQSLSQQQPHQRSIQSGSSVQGGGSSLSTPKGPQFIKKGDPQQLQQQRPPYLSSVQPQSQSNIFNPPKQVSTSSVSQPKRALPIPNTQDGKPVQNLNSLVRNRTISIDQAQQQQIYEQAQPFKQSSAYSQHEMLTQNQGRSKSSSGIHSLQITPTSQQGSQQQSMQAQSQQQQQQSQQQQIKKQQQSLPQPSSVQQQQNPNIPKYEGERMGNLRHGRGRCYYPNGELYEGEWRSDKRHGYGILRDQNGEIYNGDWQFDLYYGQGRLRNKFSEQLGKEFDFRNFENLKNYWVSYSGEFKNHSLHGLGTLILSNSEKFLGSFAGGKVHGEGTFYRQSGDIEVGFWQNNKFIGKL